MSASAPVVVRKVKSWGLEQPIGSGSFAIVWKAHHSQTGSVVAVKEINTDKLDEKLQLTLASEISVLQQINHKCIVQLIDFIKVRSFHMQVLGLNDAFLAPFCTTLFPYAGIE
jgi:serine/threonine-protein kinase ULK/ATG1